MKRLMMKLMTSRVQNVDDDAVSPNIGTRIALLGIRSFKYHHHCIVDCFESMTRPEGINTNEKNGTTPKLFHSKLFAR